MRFGLRAFVQTKHAGHDPADCFRHGNTAFPDPKRPVAFLALLQGNTKSFIHLLDGPGEDRGPSCRVGFLDLQAVLSCKICHGLKVDWISAKTLREFFRCEWLNR